MEHRGIIKSIRGYKQDFGKNEFPLSTASELVGKLDDSGVTKHRFRIQQCSYTKLDVGC
jgi:hypothetical protein